MIRVVLDTNIIVSALLQPLGPPAQVFVLAIGGSIQLVSAATSMQSMRKLLADLDSNDRTTLSRPRFKPFVRKASGFVRRKPFRHVRTRMTIFFLNARRLRAPTIW